MELVTPGIGLIFWMTITFGAVVFILGKFAWKPILHALQNREQSIAEALNSAERARKEMAILQADNDQILRQARKEHDALIKEASELKLKILADAHEQAAIETRKLIEAARQSIENEKQAALTDMKRQIASLSVSIAAKILNQELDNTQKHERLINEELDKVITIK